SVAARVAAVNDVRIELGRVEAGDTGALHELAEHLRILVAAQRSICWLRRFQREDGTFPFACGSDREPFSPGPPRRQSAKHARGGVMGEQRIELRFYAFQRVKIVVVPLA